MNDVYMNIEQVSDYLQKFNGNKLDTNVLDALSSLKETAISQGDQFEAKNLWCLEQVSKVISHYLNVYEFLRFNNFFKAWCEIERVDIEMSFLRKHLSYSDNKYKLLFIEEKIKDLEKLFPYEHFLSREAVVKSWSCSICKKVITIRNRCEHKPGEIYNGELCLKVAGDIEFIGVSIVKNPFDKYTVLFPEGMEYDYGAIIELMKFWKHPYEKWKLISFREVKKEYKEIGRNNLCPCGSQRKYKKCCLISGEDSYPHHRVLLESKNAEEFKGQKPKTFGTWRN